MVQVRPRSLLSSQRSNRKVYLTFSLMMIVGSSVVLISVRRLLHRNKVSGLRNQQRKIDSRAQHEPNSTKEDGATATSRDLCRSLQICQDSNPIFLLVLVLSDHAMTSLRDVIRRTWCSRRRFPDDTRRVACLFVVGGDFDASHQNVTEEVANEARARGDLLLTPFTDHLRNSSRKLLHALRWMTSCCSDVTFVLRTADDVIIDMSRLVGQVLPALPSNKLLAGNCDVEIPVRNAKSKYFVSVRAFPFEEFPPVCRPPAYLISADVARTVLDDNARRRDVMIPLDDVMVAVAADDAGATAADLPGFVRIRSVTSSKLTAAEACDDVILHAHVNAARLVDELWSLRRDACGQP